MFFENEYEMLGIQFLKDCNAKMEIKFSGYFKNKLWNDTAERAKYNVTITTPLGKIYLPFWDSICNTRKLKSGASVSPTAYDVLAVVEKYNPGTYKDFCEEFMFENSTHTREVYRLVKRQYEKLTRVFTDEEMDMLRGIN